MSPRGPARGGATGLSDGQRAELASAANSLEEVARRIGGLADELNRSSDSPGGTGRSSDSHGGSGGGSGADDSEGSRTAADLWEVERLLIAAGRRLGKIS